jgi:hypothetical protein
MVTGTRSTETRSIGAGDDADGQDLARARIMRVVSVVVAMVAFAVLVVAFSLGWQAYYQVAAGLAAWIAIEWQRNCSRRIRALTTSP